MEENKVQETQETAVEEVKELTPQERKAQREEAQEKIRAEWKERSEKMKVALEAIQEGKGRLALETPILSRDEEIKELTYDFMALTGLEYTEAMDSDPKAQTNGRITRRQGLALFAMAAAKQTEGLDMQDIVERIGATDAMEGIELASVFFNASTQAGRLRISKK